MPYFDYRDPKYIVYTYAGLLGKSIAVGTHCRQIALSQPRREDPARPLRKTICHSLLIIINIYVYHLEYDVLEPTCLEKSIATLNQI